MRNGLRGTGNLMNWTPYVRIVAPCVILSMKLRVAHNAERLKTIIFCCDISCIVQGIPPMP